LAKNRPQRQGWFEVNRLYILKRWLNNMSELSQKEAYHMMLVDYPDVLSFEQMCESLSISPKTGYKLLKENKIVYIKVGRVYRIPKAHIISYLMIGNHSATG
jgi:excisionase family DNA binding protein